jgi:hypothetical protein
MDPREPLSPYPEEQPDPMPAAGIEQPPEGGGGGGGGGGGAGLPPVLQEEEHPHYWGDMPELGFSPGRGGPQI